MRFSTPLLPAVLIRRYKRFLADIRFPDGTEATAHIANPGAMTGLAEPGTHIWVERNDDPKRKLRYSWQLVDHRTGHFTCVDTSLANRVVAEALAAGRIPEMSGYDVHRPEVRYGERSRVDFLLAGEGRRDCYLEVKSVTLSRLAGLAQFPDAVTARGARHLHDLAHEVNEGHRAVMLFLVMRTDITHTGIALDIDPAYGRAFDDAMRAGVEAIAYDCAIDPGGIAFGQKVALQV
jgi:sugar fermentation stimulation protein A